MPLLPSPTTRTRSAALVTFACLMLWAPLAEAAVVASNTLPKRNPEETGPWGVDLLDIGYRCEPDDCPGLNASGAVAVTDPDFLSCNMMRLGYGALGSGFLSVSGSGLNPARATTGTSWIGAAGQGSVAISQGGEWVSGDTRVGMYSGAQGEVTVMGSGTTWSASNAVIGDLGEGALTLSSGAEAHAGHGVIGNGNWPTLGEGVVDVIGDGTLWELAVSLWVGYQGMGTMRVTGGGRSWARGTANIGGLGDLTVQHAGSRFDVDSSFYNGGMMTIQQGGRAQLRHATFNGAPGTPSNAFVRGAGTRMDVSGALALGAATRARYGSGNLVIEEGAQATCRDAYLHNGQLLVQGAGTSWLVDDYLWIGQGEAGRLDIADRALVECDSSMVYGGYANVADSGSVLRVRHWMQIGVNSLDYGRLTVQFGGFADLGAVLRISNLGTLQIFQNGRLGVDHLEFPWGGGTFQFLGGRLETRRVSGRPLENLGSGTLAPRGIGTCLVDAYTQGSLATLEIEIDRLAGPSTYDRLVTPSAMNLGGTLRVIVPRADRVQAGDVFDVLDWGWLAGTFANVDLSQAVLPPNLVWDLSQLHVDGTLRVSAVADVPAPAEAPALALSGAYPNPSPAGRMTVRFSLPDDAPARLELLDIGGRRVASHEVGSRGAGTHAVRFGDERRLAPGLYFVRLVRADASRTARVVVRE